MKDLKGTALGDRLSNQAKARQAMLEKMRARPAADDPEVLKRQAERKAIAEAREARAAKRKADKLREEAERIEREKIEAAERAERELREAKEKLQAQLDLEAAQKAARDARYEARKKRKK